ncbi:MULTISPECIES: enoyl-CoA hydratase/isomerase family protein [unclassified Amycolatopsis]|uniref:enoyl-CoA hydratase/isomerase family protein n=1 Tax=unclassified Amycolatopsis TaxID=2618356 RepID=UPI00287612E5|nr:MULTISPECIES: enoyl-CoA hydratase/isomerase family protein [unclassified Amycolatopsis]MDS0137911.1 enoyl-CoA hydratase/isomerase family protein [Amycolatopsis sp. 505]MDS0144176.1 enoyl-CoA hydratase/isomerase family protein [Amycolatopsis sp. CM201R]
MTVSVLDLGAGENRFSPDWLQRVHSFLDGVEGPLVTTGSGKFYSNGLDLEWLTANGDRASEYVAEVQELFARVLTLPVPTVAAINGHAFGAGAMLAMAHDFRVMRSDRGYFCFPEADINIPFTPGMAALIQGKLTPSAAIASMTTGRRFGGPAAAEIGLVDEVAAEGDVLKVAQERVEELAGKDRGTLGAIKATMFAPAVAALRAAG